MESGHFILRMGRFHFLERVLRWIIEYRAAGFAILAGLLLSLAFITQHPIPRSNSGTEFVAEVTHLALSNSVVHGSLIACVGVLAAGYSGLAFRLGLASLVVRAGLVAYAIGAAGWVAAGLLNGFVLPEFVARYAGWPPGAQEAMRHVLKWAARRVRHLAGWRYWRTRSPWPAGRSL